MQSIIQLFLLPILSLKLCFGEVPCICLDLYERSHLLHLSRKISLVRVSLFQLAKHSLTWKSCSALKVRLKIDLLLTVINQNIIVSAEWVNSDKEVELNFVLGCKMEKQHWT